MMGVFVCACVRLCVCVCSCMCCGFACVLAGGIHHAFVCYRMLVSVIVRSLVPSFVCASAPSFVCYVVCLIVGAHVCARVCQFVGLFARHCDRSCMASILLSSPPYSLHVGTIMSCVCLFVRWFVSLLLCVPVFLFGCLSVCLLLC